MAVPDAAPPAFVERRRLLSLKEAAERCGVDYDTFLRWVRKGVVPYVRVGPCDSMRVYQRDVDALVRPGRTA